MKNITIHEIKSGFASAVLEALRLFTMNRDKNHGIRNGRNKTGLTYPHSSTRQQARYARQLAAGQLKFA